MNRPARLASWLVVLAGALVTMGTSRAPGPTQAVSQPFSRALPAGESVHVTVQISEPAMTFARANGGSGQMLLRTTAGPFTVVPDDASMSAIPLAGAGEGGAISTVLDCPAATSACELSFTLVGPAAGRDAQIEGTVQAAAPTDQPFPDDATITIVED